MEKKILVVCGTGAVSAAIISAGLRELLDRNSISGRVIACRYEMLEEQLPSADLVVSAIHFRAKLHCPVVMGTSFLTGCNVEETENRIIDLLNR